MFLAATGCAGPGASVTQDAPEAEARWPVYDLTNAQEFILLPPGDVRFDASALLRLPDGSMLTGNDRGPQLYTIRFSGESRSIPLQPYTNCFWNLQPAPTPGRKTRIDAEGLALDDHGRLYLCEEDQRTIFRCDANGETVERLKIDWTPVQRYFSSTDRNASFEGIAWGGGRLYVANERATPVISVVDPASLKVIGHFQVYPQTVSLLGTHYSDLSWHGGRLYVLCRQHRVILEVDPTSQSVVAEYNYRELEDALKYRKELPAGLMEGLSVDDQYFWVVTDNNGWGRPGKAGKRPTLLKCPRPEPTSK
jgi:uncharacterized protein YjiK